MVLDPRGRVECVATDLRAPLGRLVLAALRGELLGTLALLLLEQPGAEQAHRGRLVLRLRALVLTLDDDPRRQMRDPHRGIGLVHVLAAGARGAVGVDPQALLVELDR